MSKEEKKKRTLIEMIKADDLGQVDDDTGASLLRKPLAEQVIEEITQINFLRRIFPKITVPINSRNLTVPSVLFGSDVNVYKVAYGTEITPGGGLSETTIDTSRPIVLTPQLLVAFVDIIEDDLETAGVDLARYIREALTKKIAEAEEKAMFTGAAGAGTGYTTIYDGVYTIAAGANCATTPVTYTLGTDNLVDKLADARKDLGVYGNDPSELVLLCSLTFGTHLRKVDRIYKGHYGLGGEVLTDGTLPPIMGIGVWETSYLDAVESGEVALLVRKDAFVIGERKGIFIRQKDIEEKFSKRIIMAEEIDFKGQFKNTSDKYEGLVLIHAGS